MTRKGWMATADGGWVHISRVETRLGLMETAFYSKEGKLRALGCSLVDKPTPREEWPRVAARYLDQEKTS